MDAHLRPGPDDRVAAHARHWRAARTLYQTHIAWHQASRLDARRFETLVKFFANLRRAGRAQLARAA